MIDLEKLEQDAGLGHTAQKAEDDKVAHGANFIAAIVGLCEELAGVDAEIDKLELKLKQLKAQKVVLEERTIPGMMEEAKLPSFTTPAGDVVTVEEKIHASPNKGNRGAVCDWIDEAGDGRIIKRIVEFKFGVGEDKEAERWVKRVKRPGTFLRKVEPATLSKYVREKLEKGVEIPLDTFGVHQRKVATVDRKKGSDNDDVGF